MTTVQKNNNPRIFSFLREEKLTDVTLTADGKMVKAHKLILAASSKYFEDLFILLGDDKRTVIVLKDVPVKYLLLILEYVYCGSVDLEPEDVEEFKRVAASLQIKVEFKMIDAEMLSQDTLKHVSSTNTQEMNCTISDTSMEHSYDEYMDDSGVSPLTFSSSGLSRSNIMSNKRLEKKTVSIKKTIDMPVPKKMKIKQEAQESSVLVRETIAQSKSTEKKIPGQVIIYCVHCRRKLRENDRTYHEKFCWKNPKRIVSDCSGCGFKFDVPSKLRHHLEKCHPEKKKNPT